MKFSQIMASGGEWLRGEGPHHQIVVSSRVRLARNLRHRAFPGWAKKAERTQILEQIKPRVEELTEMQDSFSEMLQDLSALEKQVLVERHLISREHAAKGVGSAVVMNRKQTLSIMINEEDHLRMQSIRSGLQLKSAFKLVDKIDSTLEGKLDLAYDQHLGYLTACPTNVGTGMRASAMLHLPGLVLSDLINQVIQAVNKIGLAVRGLYGEGTEAMGNLFQISNQTTLGEKEDEIIARLTKVIETIIEKEHDARQMLIQKKPDTLWDQIGRAYGVLYLCPCHDFERSAQPPLDHETWLSISAPSRKTAACRSTSSLSKPSQPICKRPRNRSLTPRNATILRGPNHPRPFETLSQT